jgi:hypothetical protein
MHASLRHGLTHRCEDRPAASRHGAPHRVRLRGDRRSLIASGNGSRYRYAWCGAHDPGIVSPSAYISSSSHRDESEETADQRNEGTVGK